MDSDLRKLRYFVAVAEMKHFGRAAESLYVSQPVLSRQIQSLEKSLGCALFHRHTRRVELTPAGRQLFDDVPTLLRSFDDLQRRVREAGRGVDRLTVAFAPGLRVSASVRTFAAARPHVHIELLQLDWRDQDTPIRDGRADIGYLRRPFDSSELHVIPVGYDPVVAVMSREHRLARTACLRMADLPSEELLDSHDRNDCAAETKAEEIVARNRIALLPRGVATSMLRSDVKCIPVADVQPFETCLAVSERRSARPLHRAFLIIATDTLRETAGNSG